MKQRRKVELDFKEVPSRIDKLIDVLTPYGFEKGYQKYLRKKKSSNNVTSAHWIELIHPWYDTVEKYRQLNRNLNGLSASERFEFELVAFSSIQLDVVLNQTIIPDRVKNQLLGNLVGIETASPAMVEVHLAYHYWRDYAEITWLDSDTKDSEFLVDHAEFSFVVECKRFRSDTGKKIKQLPLTQLLNLVGPIIKTADVSGHILLEVTDTLSDKLNVLETIANEIRNAVRSNISKLELENNYGTVTLNIRPASGIITHGNIRDLADSYAPGARHAIFSQSESGNVSPLIFSCRSKKYNKIYERLGDVLRHAKKQIGSDRLGMIFVHYDGLSPGDLEKFRQEAFFASFNKAVLDTGEHVAAICYGSGPFSRVQNRDGIYNEALEFKNPKIKLPDGFSFINRGDNHDSKIILVKH